jgi:hypothetical protein
MTTFIAAPLWPTMPPLPSKVKSSLPLKSVPMSPGVNGPAARFEHASTGCPPVWTAASSLAAPSSV